MKDEGRREEWGWHGDRIAVERVFWQGGGHEGGVKKGERGGDGFVTSVVVK
jgi:hypothetical protein